LYIVANHVLLQHLPVSDMRACSAGGRTDPQLPLFAPSSTDIPGNIGGDPHGQHNTGQQGQTSNLTGSTCNTAIICMRQTTYSSTAHIPDQCFLSALPRGRDIRLEQFDMKMRDDLERRIVMRSAERNRRGADFGQRRLFRPSTIPEMMMVTPVPSNKSRRCQDWNAHSQLESEQSPVSTKAAIDDIAAAFRRNMMWSGGSPNGVQSPIVEAQSSRSPSSPVSPARLTFAGLAGAD
jgi:hypothetical protein